MVARNGIQMSLDKTFRRINLIRWVITQVFIAKRDIIKTNISLSSVTLRSCMPSTPFIQLFPLRMEFRKVINFFYSLR